ncbi:RHS repeat-associated core domain-containing protein [Saccharomonospora piscinae]|uniref:RHS repeat-associated core domain-containing protein n=1 Tax=Saccharomonospora piscinae TaxID=687388 RepID=UPI002449B488|nr:RHS repeat-associated core domain-containing protein [Saccharomonospora piscinae]
MEFNAFDELVADGTASYAYDGLNRLVEADGAALSYVGTGIKVASDHTGDYTYTPDGTPLGMTHTGGAGLAWTDSHTDLIGLIQPATGALAGSRSYSPFGEQTAHHGTQPALGYQHQYTDPDTGNVNMGARWYQPHTSTFTNRDTATLNPHDLTNTSAPTSSNSANKSSKTASTHHNPAQTKQKRSPTTYAKPSKTPKKHHHRPRHHHTTRRTHPIPTPDHTRYRPTRPPPTRNRTTRKPLHQRRTHQRRRQPQQLHLDMWGGRAGGNC